MNRASTSGLGSEDVEFSGACSRSKLISSQPPRDGKPCGMIVAPLWPDPSHWPNCPACLARLFQMVPSIASQDIAFNKPGHYFQFCLKFFVMETESPPI